MNTYMKVGLFVVAMSATLYGCNALAMGGSFRCGNNLVEVGDAQYTVQQACGDPIAQHTTNTGGRGDQEFWYYKVASNLTEEVQFIDGHVYEIHDIYN